MKECNLVDELKKDFIDHQINHNDLTEQEANLAWEMHESQYLNRIFDHIAEELQEL